MIFCCSYLFRPQVDLGGESHALEPLAAISKQFHVFTRPTLFRNALWLPYRCGLVTVKLWCLPPEGASLFPNILLGLLTSVTITVLHPLFSNGTYC